MSKIKIDIAISNEGFDAPSQNEIFNWLNALFEHKHIQQHKKVSREVSVSFCMIGFSQMQELNKQYRQKDKPTNVLSFPCPIPNAPGGFLGDIVLCVPQIEREAKEQHKSLSFHWAHLILHGTLHLLGYDHETEQEAIEMENLEVDLLAQLSMPNPYGALHE